MAKASSKKKARSKKGGGAKGGSVKVKNPGRAALQAKVKRKS